MYERRNNWLRQSLVSLACLCAVGYFVFHAINGKHGLEARARLLERSSLLEPEIVRLEAVLMRLQRDVELLGSTPPDQDLVEELAFEVLGLVRAGDLVIVTP